MLIFDASCKKTTTDDLTVNITSPVEGTTYNDSIFMSFSINAVAGLDSCFVALTDASSSNTYYFSNNFLLGSTIRNKTSFSYSFTLTALPSTLTPAKFTLTVVDLKKNRFTKVINVSIKQ